MKTPLGTEVGIGAGHSVLEGFPAFRERGTAPPSFRPMSIVATVAHLSHCWALVTPVRSVTLGLPWRSLWLQVWAHLWCNRGWLMPTPLCTECQHLTYTNYSLSKILSLVWFCLFFAIFQQVSDSVSSTGFPFTTEYSSKSLHLPIRS